MADDKRKLVLRVEASNGPSIGFGDVFNCQVKQVIHGTCTDQNIRLTVLASDKATAAFLSAHPVPQEIEIVFRQLRENEPYSTAPISGFVDHTQVSWEIESVRNIEH